jgi:hypothetical protein
MAFLSAWLSLPSKQAAVMLTSNVMFLAIQCVDTNADPFRSDAQLFSYLSVVANTGALIMGLLLMRQNRTKNLEAANNVVSVGFAVPYVLLIHMNCSKNSYAGMTIVA